MSELTKREMLNKNDHVLLFCWPFYIFIFILWVRIPIKKNILPSFVSFCLIFNFISNLFICDQALFLILNMIVSLEKSLGCTIYSLTSHTIYSLNSHTIYSLNSQLKWQLFHNQRGSLNSTQQWVFQKNIQKKPWRYGHYLKKLNMILCIFIFGPIAQSIVVNPLVHKVDHLGLILGVSRCNLLRACLYCTRNSL